MALCIRHAGGGGRREEGGRRREEEGGEKREEKKGGGGGEERCLQCHTIHSRNNFCCSYNFIQLYVTGGGGREKWAGEGSRGTSRETSLTVTFDSNFGGKGSTCVSSFISLLTSKSLASPSSVALLARLVTGLTCSMRESPLGAGDVAGDVGSGSLVPSGDDSALLDEGELTLGGLRAGNFSTTMWNCFSGVFCGLPGTG